jgi:hypothetical protein
MDTFRTSENASHLLKLSLLQSDIRNKLQIIGRDLGVEVLADWYKVVGDRRVAELAQYFGSPLALLQTTYPEHYWLPWLFPRVPSGFWKPQSNQRKYMDWLFGRLGLSRLDNWYDVKRSQLDKVGANSMLDVLYQGSLTKALTTLYPEVRQLYLNEVLHTYIRFCISASMNG